MYNSVGKIFEEAAEHRGWVLESRVDRGLSRHQVRKDVSIHEREEVFEVNGEDRPWVCEGQTGKGEIKRGSKDSGLGEAECMSSIACSRCVRALLTAVETGTSLSGVASSSSSSSSAGMMVAGGACR